MIGIQDLARLNRSRIGKGLDEINVRTPIELSFRERRKAGVEFLLMNKLHAKVKRKESIKIPVKNKVHFTASSKIKYK